MKAHRTVRQLQQEVNGRTFEAVIFSFMISRLFPFVSVSVLALTLTSCVTDEQHIVEVSVPQQRMAVYRDGVRIREYPISTSKFGLGDDKGSNHTPLGAFRIAKKIGKDAPAGAVFKSRKPTGEVLLPDAPGRDPIVTRILWLKGTEANNANAYKRYIYIHGTPEERTIGTPASYGCVRMKSSDVIDLFEVVGNGARVYIANLPLQGQASQ
jgi:lipoprotein-anchoring transpeptidase ErfK/SrfK